MAADALAPCVAKASAAKVLTMEDKQVCVFHKALNYQNHFRGEK